MIRFFTLILSVSSRLIPNRSTKRPNVLVICTDAFDGRLVENRSYGQLVDLPNIAKLQDAGTTFARTYCDSPLCVPSRAAIFSGFFILFFKLKSYMKIK